MPDSSDSRLERALRLGTVALSALFVLLFLFVAARRMRYPFELDRVESGMLTTVWRLRHGFPLYSAPSLDWAPFLYAPLFFYLSAAVTKVVGISFGTLRLVSTLATLGSFGFIFLLVWKETRRFAAAALAVGLFASLYPIVFAWFDVGRVDSLSTFFFLAAVYATRRLHPLAAALLWLLAFLTKQTFLPLGLAVFLIDWQRPRRMFTGMVAFLLMAGGSVFWLNHTTQGWFSFYAFGTPGVLGWSSHQALMFPFADLLAPWPIAVALIVMGAACTGVRWRSREGGYLALVTALLTAAIWFVRAHAGANLNALIPLYAWMSVLVGIAADRLLRWSAERSVQGNSSGHPRAAFPALLWLVAGLQLAAHLYRPAEVSHGDPAARQRFLAALKATPGDVWVVDHSYDNILVGKPVHADMDALDAVLGRGYKPAVTQFAQLTGGGHFTAVVLDRTPEAYKPSGLFTLPPFSPAYGVRSVAPGYGEPDQPSFVLTGCGTLAGPAGSLLDTSTGFVDRSACSAR
ncbi:MAG: glycosyltransferase 87 family protein [Janthinobacterium lividum]